MPRRSGEPKKPVMCFAAPDASALRELRTGLLHHHRVLMEHARRDYERLHGRIAGPGQLLHLLMQDPEFGWLRMLSSLLAELDESLEEPVPGETEAVVAAIARLLLEVEADDGGFQVRYRQALQDSPDVVLSHAQVGGALRKLRGVKFDLHLAP